MSGPPKKKRPISRKFWSLLRFLPDALRAMVIRSQFEVDDQMPKELVLRQAETADEIRQALKIVHDAYVELNYMDAQAEELRFSAHHALPTSVILVAMWENEVIGTMTIIPDSALGLPTDSTWNLNRYREKGQLIAEISSLSIKKNFRMRRGKLLLPLCKLMYQFCTEILKLDGIVIATSLEVEPFYTDVLLFEKVVKQTGQKHALVKGNPSTCCFLPLNENTVQAYKNIYNHRPKNKNLYHFFVIAETPNIQLPESKKSLSALLSKKTAAQAELMQQSENLMSGFTSIEKQVIKNLDVSNILPEQFACGATYDRKTSRLEIRLNGWCLFKNSDSPVFFQFVDISRHGFHLHLKNTVQPRTVGEEFLLTLQFENELLQCRARVRWAKNGFRLGCSVLTPAPDWEKFTQEILREITPAQIIPFKKVGS